MMKHDSGLITLERVVALLNAYEDEVGIQVEHEPLTPRYERAQEKIPFLLKFGKPIGLRKDEFGRIDVAIFAENGRGGRASGYYSCFRFHMRLGQLEISYAELWCYYDGQDQEDSLPKRWTPETARAFALSPEMGFSTQGVPP